MHNYIETLECVRLLKGIPLHPYQIWSKYAYWPIRFHSNHTVFAPAAVQTIGSQVRRSHQGLVVVSLESFAGSDVRSAYWLQKS